MKKIFFVLLSLLLLPVNVSAKDNIDEDNMVVVKGILVESKLLEIKDRIMIPVDDLQKYFRYSIRIDDKNIYIKSNDELKLKLDSKEGMFNGQNVILEVSPIEVKGKLYIPLRFVAEKFGEVVIWDEVNSIAIVGDYVDNNVKGETKILNEFSLVIPKGIENRYIIEERKSEVEIFDAFNRKADEKSGYLCTIIKTDIEARIMKVIPSILLNYIDGNYYIAVFASDVQYNPEDKISEIEYNDSKDKLIEILKSFRLESK